MGAIEMKGLTNIGSYTLSSITPPLTGHLVEEIYEQERQDDENNPWKGYHSDKELQITKFDKVLQQNL